MASRKAGWDDGESWLLESSSLVGSELSFGVDRGDLYVFYRNASGSLAYRRHLQGLGWDAAESVLDSLATAHYLTARTRLNEESRHTEGSGIALSRWYDPLPCDNTVADPMTELEVA